MKKILDMKKMGALALGLMAFAPAAMAQDEVETSIGADIVSQYYWRGQDLGAVSLQPTLGIGYKGLSLTAWGSVGLSQPEDTKEFDLTLAYETGGFHIGVTDYWFNSPNEKYFAYKAHETSHVFEANVGYDFGPLALTGTPTSPATMESTRMATVLIHLISRLPLHSSWVVATGRQALVQCHLPPPFMVMPTVLPLPT